ncbi:MAG: hypothetical protein RML40_03170 [Bacteroidota bacterium]|nr:hypothetical protein [Candidatus Kapabacteria bacterium]MDW8219511.1 hypothetical protein [Bacteroidota bacterium]
MLILALHCTSSTSTAQEGITTLHWEIYSQGLPISFTPPRVVNITALVSAPNRFAPMTLLFAATSGFGVFRSADSGRTWNPVNTGLTALTVNTLFTDGSTIYAGTTNGLFRTIDAGQRWDLVPVRTAPVGGFGTSFITAGVVGQVAGRKAIFLGSAHGVFRTFDDGITWEHFNRGLSSTQYISTLHIFQQRLFAGTPNEGVLYIDLEIANDSWKQPQQGLFPLSVTSFATLGLRVFAGTNGAGVFQSMDTGRTWTAVNNDLNNPTVTALAVAGTRLYASTSTGVYATATAGQFWTNINTGFPISSVRSLLPFDTYLFVAAGSNILRGSIFASRPPIISLVSPSSTPSRLTGAPLEVTLTGSNFNNPLVLFDGVGQALVRWSPTSVVFQIPVSQLASEGLKTITLQNADGQRTTAFFTVSGAISPFIRDIEPDSVTAGSPPFILDIRGRTFFHHPTRPDSSATVRFGDIPLEVISRVGTSFLLARVPQEAIAEPGRRFVRVTNPNGEFFDFPFRIRAFPPRITELDPPRVSIGNSTFILTIRGQHFFTERNVDMPGQTPLFVRLADVPLQVLENTTSSRVVVSVPATLVTSQATLTLRLTNADGQFAETTLDVVPFSISPIATPQTRICPGARTPLTVAISSGVPPFRVVWSPPVDSFSIDNNGTIRAFVSPRQPTRYTLTVTDRDGTGVPLTTSIFIDILQPQASAPSDVRFDTVNTFFRLSAPQTLRFTNISPDSTVLTLTSVRSVTGAFRATGGIGTRIAVGQTLNIPLIFDPPRDGVFLDTLTLHYEPCERVVRVVVRGFRTTPILAPPILVPVATQPDGRVPVSLAPPLSWLPSEFVSTPTAYTIQIARVEAVFSEQTGLASPIFTTTVNRVTSTQPTFTLQPNTAYAWTVRASNSVTSSTWSVPLYFITPPATQQRLFLDPPQLDFGHGILHDSERRGLQLRLSPQQSTPIDILSAELFPPRLAPRAAFDFAPAFTRSTVTQRTPTTTILTFTPRDTVLHQGVVRFRSSAGDTIYALLSGRGVLCTPPSSHVVCAETDIAFRVAPLSNNAARPQIGDTVNVQLVLQRSTGLDAPVYRDRAQIFSADIWLENANVLLPLRITQPSALSSQQYSITPNRIRLRNIPSARAQRTSNVLLAEFQARVLLTDTTATALRLAEFTWNDELSGSTQTRTYIRKILRDTSLAVETYGRLIRPRAQALLTSFAVAPNPALYEIHVLISLSNAVPLELTLVNSIGTPVYTERLLFDDAGTYNISINTRDLISGVYTLIARAQNEIFSRHIIISRQ